MSAYVFCMWFAKKYCLCHQSMYLVLTKLVSMMCVQSKVSFGNHVTFGNHVVGIVLFALRNPNSLLYFG